MVNFLQNRSASFFKIAETLGTQKSIKNGVGAGSSWSARRYEVSSGKTSHDSIVRFQTVSMSATSASNNHVATQNNVMMNSVAVDASIQAQPYK